MAAALPQLLNLKSDVIKNYLLNLGAAEVGFGDVSQGLSKEMKHLPIAISLAVPLPFVKRCGYTNELLNYNCHWEEQLTLEKLQRCLVKFLRTYGYRCLAIPPDTYKDKGKFIFRLYLQFSHKMAVTSAGLGWVGKNGLVIHEKYGPSLIWATVLTNAPLETTGMLYTAGKCGKCRRCVDACPVGAIPDREWRLEEGLVPHIDVEACQKQLERNLLNYGKAVCGICIAVCPIGKQEIKKPIPLPFPPCNPE